MEEGGGDFGVVAGRAGQGRARVEPEGGRSLAPERIEPVGAVFSPLLFLSIAIATGRSRRMSCDVTMDMQIQALD
jgi:hypothetical protein